MWKKHQVVMLPTEKADKLISDRRQLILFDGKKLFNPFENDTYNLFILSDDEIKEGWFLNTRKNTIHKVYCVSENIQSGINGREYHGKFECKKIIATTDESLNIHWNKQDYKSLPQLSQQFIEKFTDEYNKGNVISDVMVEYDTISVPYVTGDGFEIVLKINSDNTINIKTVKDSWNKEEVIGLLEEFNDRFGNLSLIGDFKEQDRPKFNKWIEEKI